MQTADAQREVRVPAGTIRYRDTGGGEPLVFLHGLLVNGTLWRDVTPLLEDRFRCIVPDLPLGAHPVPMDPDADLTPPGIARIVVDLLDALGLDQITLVCNDTGGAYGQLVAAAHPDRISRLVLSSVDALEVFPPRFFGWVKLAATIPGGAAVLANTMRIRPLRRAPIAYGWLARTPVPDDLLEAWVRPMISTRGVRRDAAKVLRSVSPRYTMQAAEALRTFPRPVLLPWGGADRFFPVEFAERFASIFPDARLDVIEGSGTFTPIDAPGELAKRIAAFAQMPR